MNSKEKKKISRREFLAGAGAAGAATLVAGKVIGHYVEPEAFAFIPTFPKRGPCNDFNVITIVLDTLRYDHLGFHGYDGIHTPNLDNFAATAQVFRKAYSAGFPTLLNRAEFFTGRYMYSRMGWEDLPADEVVLANVLNEAGYTTGLVFDTLHLKNGNSTLNRGFQSWEWIRGQGADRYRAVPLNPPLPADPSKLRHGAETVSQYLRNMADRKGEEDYLVAKTMSRAIEWLRGVSGHNKFYLHVDSFDPHEPWDPPQAYVDQYDPGYTGDEVIYPAYAPPDYLTPRELAHVRALYKAEVTMVDHWVGKLLDEIDTLGLADNTIVVLFSDHGYLFGEHNAVGKAWNHEGRYAAYPLYEELVHIPLMIRIPGVSPATHSALAQPADIMPTILDLLKVDLPETVEGASLVPAIVDGVPSHEFVVASRSLTSLAGEPRITVTDGRWSLHYGGSHTSSALYDLDNDPGQQTNLLGGQCAVARTLHAQLVSFLESLDLPEERISPWRSAPC